MQTAAENFEKQYQTARKVAIAKEHFRFVTEKNLDDFNAKLRAESRRVKTVRMSSNREVETTTYKALLIEDLKDYSGIPPKEVIEKVKQAKALKCFDKFEVASIVEKQHQRTIEKVPDPIIFGRVHESDLRFYIAQWDNDVRIEDILEPMEG